jgi:hypothetical protein
VNGGMALNTANETEKAKAKSRRMKFIIGGLNPV